MQQRTGGDLALGQQLVHRVLRGDEGARDGGGAGAAIGLQHIAVERNGAFAERLEVEHRAQRAADQALDLLGATALLALGGLAAAAAVGGARQHAVFGRDPALAAAALMRRHLFLDRGGTLDLGVAELDQHRALGMNGVVAGEAHRAQGIGAAAIGAQGRRSQGRIGHGGGPGQ